MVLSFLNQFLNWTKIILMNSLYQNLNKEQIEAVDYSRGPILIVAGAGSGKTRVLTSRLMAILRAGAAPESIVAITFTNKAAEEMRKRISNQQPTTDNLQHVNKNMVVGRRLSVVGPFIGTFHAFGARILKKEARLAGRSANFSIYDEDDAMRVIKNIVKNANLSEKEKRNLSPAGLRREFSRIKNELTDIEEEDEKIQFFYKEYELALAQNNAFDFDDLIEKPARLFWKNKNILEKYQNQLRHILVDEFQDTNIAQYVFVKLLAQKHKNLSVVGDDQQCVLPTTKITTTKGVKMIKDLTFKDEIVAASGNGGICAINISKIKKMQYSGPLIKITTVNDKVLKLTPNHLIFIRPQLLNNIYFVYLMYRKDMGFRIGITRGARYPHNRKPQIGIITRNNQEKADKVWILKICLSREDATYYEFYYAFLYGIPTVVFDTNNRSMKLTQGHINKLYASINTKERVKKLMEDELIYFSYPHWAPQGTIRHASKRLRIRLTLFDDKRKSLIHPWGMSRISVNTKDLNLKREIEKIGFKTRKGKIFDWRLEIAKMDYGVLEKIGDRLQKIDSEIEIVRSACLTKNKRLFFQPAAHARPTMLIAVKNGNEIKEEEIKKVEIEMYDGYVYDLDIENVHNYVANNFVVHNSIYGFRGSDYRNFLNFENDWPNTKIVFLEQNYRSTRNIIKAASELIKKNKFQKHKNLWTENSEGELVKVIECQNEDDEGERIATKIQKSKFKNQNCNIAVLYRTNAQSRAIESALIEEGIPYRIFGGIKFYERKEIKDILAGLRWAANPNDSVSLERLEKNLLKPQFRAVYEGLSGLAEKLKPTALIDFFLETTNYFSQLKKEYLNFEERVENIQELVRFASDFDNLSDFLERVSLFQSADAVKNSKNGNEQQLTLGDSRFSVNLMTIHLAKGLEFDAVFIAGCNDGLMPHQMSYYREEEIEEERRLMYVAMTRAKKELFISFYNMPSRFLYELPPELIEFTGERSLEDEERYISFYDI